MYEYSRGRSFSDNQPEQRQVGTFDDFCAAILQDRGLSKGEQYICAPMAVASDDELHRGQDNFNRSIGHHHRCKACALPRRWIGLDIDGGLDEATFEKFSAAISQYNVLIYTTSSHKEGDFHLRVVVETDRLLNRDELKIASRVFRGMVDRFLPGIAIKWDTSCDKAEQPLYLPLKTAHHLRLTGRPFVAAIELMSPPKTVPPTLQGNTADSAQSDSQALSVLKKQCKKLAESVPGTRNNTLNDVSHLLGGYVGAGRLVRAGVEEALFAATIHWSDPEKTKGTIRSGLESGIRRPIHDHSGVPAGHEYGAALDSESMCSDLANANRIVQQFGKRLLYVEGVGWHIFKSPWRLDELAAKKIVYGLSSVVAAEAQAMQSWCDLAESPAQHAERLAAMELRWKWAKKCEQLSVVENAMRMAEPLLSCKASEMDADPLLVGTPGGILDLSTCTVRPYTERDRISKTIVCDYHPASACPTFMTFIQGIMGGDVELIDYLQRILGYAISGQRHEQMLPILYGTGANGKSTLVNAVQGVLGDYASTAAPGLLVTKFGQNSSVGEADLMGRRLVVVSETGESEKLNEEQVKRLTSREPIKARRLYQQLMQFDPTHLILLQTNHKPRVAGTDHGIWRRLKLIPFLVTIPEHLRDTDLGSKLRSEYAGLLAWMVEGWKKYQVNGLPIPRAVAAATAEYRSASDKIGMFLAEYCRVGSQFSCTTEQLYKAYERWCMAENERPVSKNRLTQLLLERGGFSQTRTKIARGWQGVAVEISALGLPGGLLPTLPAVSSQEPPRLT